MMTEVVLYLHAYTVRNTVSCEAHMQLCGNMTLSSLNLVQVAVTLSWSLLDVFFFKLEGL